VALEELYAGAGERERRAVERLERDFDRVKRTLAANLSESTLTREIEGKLVAEGGLRTPGL